MIKNVYVEPIYLLDIFNTSKISHESKLLDIVGIWVNNFNEKFAYLRRPYK